MSRREAWLSAGLVFVIALVVRVVVAAALRFPTPEDTAYYVSVARNLVEGRGLVSDAIWSFQTPPLTFPRPAFEVWLPLPTFLAAAAMAVVGPTFAAAKVSAVLVGSLVPVLAWRLAADVGDELALPVGRRRTLAFGTGLTAAVWLPLLLFGALPDSTMPFAALALASTILMARVLRRPPMAIELTAGEPAPPGATRRAVVGDRRILALGVLLGLAALTRNEALWLGLTWALIAWRSGPPGSRLAIVAVPAAIAALIFAPWAIRDWLTFGTPLPGQALANALSVTGFDIFAWNDPPTLSRYLAIGPARLLDLRVEGLAHNAFSVLVIPGFPISLIGLIGLPWFGRLRSLRPLVIVSLATFLVTSLVFPVSTTWGTFLHAAGPVHVLLLISCLLALDALIVRVGRWRGWTRPVAWLAPTLTLASAILFSLTITGYIGHADEVAHRYRALEARMAAIGRPLDASAGPVVTDFPIWMAEALRIPTLALPDEPPADVVDLAGAFPGSRYLVTSGEHGRWPDVLDTGQPGSECFREVALGAAADPSDAKALEDTHVFQIVCP